MMTKHAAERYALIAAGAVIVALTAGGFWLSYAHLAEVAGAHGLGRSPARRWAWPATLDAFIVAGELLMLRAGLRRVPDKGAITLTATGSVGSIALNVAGVNGSGNASNVPLLDYVVAAVPPTAALLAFGVLMRQIHQLVDRPADRPEPISGQAQEPLAPAFTGPFDLPAATSGTPAKSASGTGPRSHGQPHPAHDSEPEGGPAPSGAPHSPSEPVPASEQGVPAPRRTGRPPNASIDELLTIARPVVARMGDIDRAEIAKEIREVHGRKVSNDRLQKVIERLEDEQDALWDSLDDID
jgi:hypothetical protein